MPNHPSNCGPFKRERRLALCAAAAMMALSACSQSSDSQDRPAPPNAGASEEAAPSQTAQMRTKYADVDFKPEFNAAGELVQPKGFRLWTFIGTPLTPNGLNNGAAGFPEYHNVYVQPKAFDHYRATGEWPEGTMMVKELQLVKTDAGNFDDGSRMEPSGRGYFPAVVNGLDVSVKDSSRYADTDSWGYFNFGHNPPPYAASAPAAPKEACAQCHIDNAHEDMVFIEFYKSILEPLPAN